MTNMAKKIYDTKAVWANDGAACDATCLGTNTKVDQLDYLSSNSAPTTHKLWITKETLKMYKTQFDLQPTTDGGVTTPVTTEANTEAAYMYVNYTTALWMQVDFLDATVTTKLSKARAQKLNTIMYKDTIDTLKLWTTVGLSSTNVSWATLIADGTAATYYTNPHLRFLHEINATPSDYADTSLNGLKTNGWYAGETDVNIDSLLMPFFPSWKLTASTNYKAITDKKDLRDKINDLIFVAKKWSDDVTLNTGTVTTSEISQISVSAKDSTLTNTSATNAYFMFWPAKAVTANFAKKFFAF
jgi:hypothetical protein